MVNVFYMLRFKGEVVSVADQSSKNCLFNMSAATLQIWHLCPTSATAEATKGLHNSKSIQHAGIFHIASVLHNMWTAVLSLRQYASTQAK
jgi:hypothetical protein